MEVSFQPGELRNHQRLFDEQLPLSLHSSKLFLKVHITEHKLHVAVCLCIKRIPQLIPQTWKDNSTGANEQGTIAKTETCSAD